MTSPPVTRIIFFSQTRNALSPPTSRISTFCAAPPPAPSSFRSTATSWRAAAAITSLIAACWLCSSFTNAEPDCFPPVYRALTAFPPSALLADVIAASAELICRMSPRPDATSSAASAPPASGPSPISCCR